MRLYLISRTDDIDYDEYDSFVVVAESEKSALEWHPNGQKINYSLDEEHIEYDYCHSWTSKENLKIECIGESNSQEEKVIISSFNAG